MASNAPKINPLNRIRYMIEFIPLMLMIGIFLALGPASASNLGGKLARKIGPKLGKNRKAIAHLKMAFPGKTDDEYNLIVGNMWEHLGRIFGEYPYLNHHGTNVELDGIEHIKKALEEYGQVILFSGHIGNWEVMPPALLEYGINIGIVYRPLNNPYADKVLNYYRSLNKKLLTIPKSKTGTRLLVERVRDEHSVSILIDQKYNEGLAVPFFGHAAMTSPAFAQLGQKYDCPVVPFRMERLKGTEFRLTFFEPLNLFEADGTQRPAEALLHDANKLLEQWITERPEQWIWLHRRWIDMKNPGKKATAKIAKSAAPKTAPAPKPDPQSPGE